MINIARAIKTRKKKPGLFASETEGLSSTLLSFSGDSTVRLVKSEMKNKKATTATTYHIDTFIAFVSKFKRRVPHYFTFVV
jgi:hypothetical protein